MSDPILAVDPGLVNGYAWWYPGETITPWTGEAGFEDCYTDVAGWLNAMPGGVTVVCERYVINATTHKKTQATWSLEGMGVLRWLCSRTQNTFKLYTAGESKRFSTDDKLRRVGWYRPSRGGHMNDALRLVLRELADRNELPPGLLRPVQE